MAYWLLIDIFLLFSGSCFANPLLCEHGLTISNKIKVSESTLSSSTPKYIIDSGAHNGRGFSLYVQNKQLYAEVAQNGQLWRVSALF